MTRPVRSATQACWSLSRSQAGGRPAILPDQGRRDGLAGRPLPDDRRLALIGQADGRDPVGLHARLVERAGHLRPDRAEQGIRIVLDPARSAGKSAGPRPGPGRRPGAERRRRRPACWSFPGRSPRDGRASSVLSCMPGPRMDRDEPSTYHACDSSGEGSGEFSLDRSARFSGMLSSRRVVRSSWNRRPRPRFHRGHRWPLDRWRSRSSSASGTIGGSARWSTSSG